MKITQIKTPAECLKQLTELEAGGGIQRDDHNRIIPLCLKSKHLVARLLELGGRTCPEYNSISPEGDPYRQQEVRQTQELFRETEARILVPRPAPRPPQRGLSPALMRHERSTGARSTKRRRAAA